VDFRSRRVLALGLLPIVLTACVEISAATAPPASTAPAIGVDLGSSSRAPQIARLAGEQEDPGHTEPETSPHGSMAGMMHRSMDRSAMQSHVGTTGTQMDHASMAGMNHAPMSGMSMDHGGMKRAPQPETASGQGSIGGMRAPRHEMRMVHSGHAHVQATGTVNSVNAAGHKLNLSHGPISTIGWPAMTMDCAVAPSIDLNAVNPGTRIRFEMEKGPDGSYVIQSIAPAGGERK
jgi:Cu(I)/Ag(I) efflux system periplasmic protein CusF